MGGNPRRANFSNMIRTYYFLGGIRTPDDGKVNTKNQPRSLSPCGDRSGGYLQQQLADEK